MKNGIAILLLVVIFFNQSCTKEEGEGGTSTITGKLYVLDYNMEYTKKIGEYYAQAEDVYIVYGDGKVYSDRFETHLDGTYEFRYLTEGTYTIYAYSEDTTQAYRINLGTPPLIPVTKTVTITKKKQVVEVEDIIIVK